MKILYTISCTILSVIVFAQPKIELKTTEFDFGQIITTGTIKKVFIIKNIGNEPLIITRVTTGDGGSYATYPKQPILPDETGEITFYYNSNRIGPFRKRLMIQSNAENKYGKSIKITGEVIHKTTEIELQQDTIDIGEIPFGTIAKATFKVKNIGQEKLYLNLLSGKYYEPDLFYQKIEPNQNKRPFEINETANVTIVLRNVYGNVGYFQRKILLKYNSLDTAFVLIKGNYIGKPPVEKRYEERRIYQYENGQLKTQTELTYSGDVRQVSYYKGAYCTHSKYYSWQTGSVTVERFFEFGELIEERRYE